MFLSVHSGGGQVNRLNLGLFLGYIVPLTCQGIIKYLLRIAFKQINVCAAESSVMDGYPNSPQYPKFYQLNTLLRGMVSENIKVHPLTREMLSALDQ